MYRLNRRQIGEVPCGEAKMLIKLHLPKVIRITNFLMLLVSIVTHVWVGVIVASFPGSCESLHGNEAREISGSHLVCLCVCACVSVTSLLPMPFIILSLQLLYKYKNSR